MDTTKEKIIETTLELVGKSGITGLTTRQIARKSGVNVAALNYHFGSKDNLISEAFKYFKLQVELIFDALIDPTIPAKERLKIFIIDYVNHLNKNPGIPRALITMTISGNNLNPEFLEMMSFGKDRFINTIAEITEIENEKLLTMMAMRFFSCIIYPVLMGNYLENIFDFSYNNPEDREKYLDLVISDILE